LAKLVEPDDGKKEHPRGKLRSKVVLKAIADVKALRATATKSPPPGKPQPVKAASAMGGKKKSKAGTLVDDAFVPEPKEALPRPAPVGVQPRRSDVDGGPPPPVFPPRK
jgi:hypothetical protein